LVAIVGGSAVGKGRLARALADALPVPAKHVELDAFYRDLSAMPPARQNEQNFDRPAAVDWPRMRTVFDGLRAGRTVEVPEYDFAQHTRRPESRRLDPAPMILWDGLWLLDWSWCGRRFDFSIYVECEPAVCLERRLQRDVHERGRTPDSVRQQYRSQVLPMQRRFVEPQRLWADAVVRSPWDAGAVNELAGALARPAAEFARTRDHAS
jgi:uridine kinase